MPCPKTLFPRVSVPKNFGDLVNTGRTNKKWSRVQLADMVGVAHKTIARLERRETVPSLQLVRALLRNEVLGRELPLVRGWELDDPDAANRGFRVRAARLASDQTLAEVVAAAGGSIASLSAFERQLLAPIAYAGDPDRDDGHSVTEAYAKALGFVDRDEMKAYLRSDDPLPWLAMIAERHGCDLPPAALLPTKRQRLDD